jgi:protein-S-isoprenylcysteine O-methyltransferase Ste14
LKLGAELVAWIAFLRCVGVAVAIARQALRAQRAVVTKWGLIETLAAPEPFLMAGMTYALFTQNAGHQEASWMTAALVLLGILVAVMGAALWLWAFATIPGLSSGHYVLPEQTLITHGPYARVRHPIYFAVVLIWVALAAAYASIGTLAVALLYVVPAYGLYARAEERMMVEHFGSAYRQYQRETGMLFPRLRAGGE